MTKIADIVYYLESLFPKETAEDYDNPGLLAGSSDGEVSICMLSLDATSDIVNRAISESADLLITHHPVIFGGIDTVCTDDPCGRILTSAIKNDIAIYAAHTNLDKNPAYSNGVLARRIGDEQGTARPLEGTSCGVAFDLPVTLRLGDYIEQIKDSLEVTGVITINDLNSGVRRVFAQGGAFDEDSIPALIDNGIDVVVSGEIKHHITLLLEEYGIRSVIAGHKATEDVFMPNLADDLTKRFPDVRFLVSL